MAIYILDGNDKEINVLGRYASVKNNGDETVYASSTPDLDDLEASDIVPVQPGESAVVRDCNKKLFVRGSGQIAVVSGNQPFNFFKSAPNGGNGGGGTSGGGITQQQLDDTLKLYATNASVNQKLDDFVPVAGGSFNGDVRFAQGAEIVLSENASADIDEQPNKSTGRLVQKNGIVTLENHLNKHVDVNGVLQGHKGGYFSATANDVKFGYTEYDGNGNKTNTSEYSADFYGISPYQTGKDLGNTSRKWQNLFLSGSIGNSSNRADKIFAKSIDLSDQKFVSTTTVTTQINANFNSLVPDTQTAHIYVISLPDGVTSSNGPADLSSPNGTLSVICYDKANVLEGGRYVISGHVKQTFVSVDGKSFTRYLNGTEWSEWENEKYAAAVGGYSAEQLIQSNPNLLLNPNFKINQKGKNEYVNESGTVDRWKSQSGFIVTVTDKGVEINPNKTITGNTNLFGLMQTIECPKALWGKPVTLSVSSCNTNDYAYVQVIPYAADNTSILYPVSSKIPISLGISQVVLKSIPENAAYIRIQIVFNVGATVEDALELEWVKLEIGSVATPFVPPNLLEEALKCGPLDDPKQKVLFGNGEWNDISAGHNLLDNPNFKINQRGQSEYSIVPNQTKNTADRWKIYQNTKLTIGDDIITIGINDPNLNNGVIQVLQTLSLEYSDIAGEHVTISLLDTDNILYTATAKVPADPPTSTATLCIAHIRPNLYLELWWKPESARCFVNIYGTNFPDDFSYQWIKLEIGSVATPFIPPDPTLELLKCQRYCMALTGDVARVYTMNTNALYFILPTPVPMRVNPSIENSVHPLIKTYGTGDTTDGFAYTFLAKSTPPSLVVNATKNAHGISTSTGGVLMIPTGERLVLSADL